jgi:predicted RNA-binding protein with PIN domain
MSPLALLLLVGSPTLLCHAFSLLASPLEIAAKSPQYASPSLSLLVMKRGSRKKSARSPPQSGLSSSAATNSGVTGAQDRPPIRVDPNQGISVRQQLKFVHLKKEREKMATQRSGSPVPRTKFRKDKDEEPEYVEEPDLSKVKVSTIAPTLMVDGYNMLHAWDKTKFKIQSGQLLEARQILTAGLIELSSMRNWKTLIIYDAYNTDSLVATKMRAGPHVFEIFTAKGQTADQYIERETQLLKMKGCDSVMIATGDNVISTVAGGHGALVMTPFKILQEINIAQRESIAIADKRRTNRLAAQRAMAMKDKSMSQAVKEGFGLLDFMDEETRNLILSRRVDEEEQGG